MAKVIFKGLTKNTAQVIKLFALSRLGMARKKLMATMGVVRVQGA
ncbi:transposase, IS4 family protein [Hylemonella gracilis ATCC 19624]|uniref:Transposase, IS4 family protein n=1 Tax=Hylemonella gracilis ATCC 19624 TaxID=887062 RepID=F3KSI2_9BURK|nr:transposase, IS4 family protein [Hylemonella gracilis ATCC 19624]